MSTAGDRGRNVSLSPARRAQHPHPGLGTARAPCVWEPHKIGGGPDRRPPQAPSEIVSFPGSRAARSEAGDRCCKSLLFSRNIRRPPRRGDLQCRHGVVVGPRAADRPSGRPQAANDTEPRPWASCGRRSRGLWNGGPAGRQRFVFVPPPWPRPLPVWKRDQPTRRRRLRLIFDHQGSHHLPRRNAALEFRGMDRGPGRFHGASVLHLSLSDACDLVACFGGGFTRWVVLHW